VLLANYRDSWFVIPASRCTDRDIVTQRIV
jgi:hypothetical protein